MEILQSGQEDDPSRSTGGSGYAEIVQLRDMEQLGELSKNQMMESQGVEGIRNQVRINFAFIAIKMS